MSENLPDSRPPMEESEVVGILIASALVALPASGLTIILLVLLNISLGLWDTYLLTAVCIAVAMYRHNR